MEVKKVNRVLFIVVLLKILGGLLTHSYTMISSCVLDLLLIIISKIAMIKGEDSKGKRVVTFLIGLIMILSAIILVILSIVYYGPTLLSQITNMSTGLSADSTMQLVISAICVIIPVCAFFIVALRLMEEISK